jgi:type II secretory pathway component PulF|tara:strand:- start:88 stop:264 length:177 start_codon:yes stop_codon:yes gene_type:complete
MRQNPSESEKLESFERFREEMSKDVDEGVDDHESKMTKMGFMFLGIFVGVIALAAFLP